MIKLILSRNLEKDDFLKVHDYVLKLRKDSVALNNLSKEYPSMF